MAQELVLDATNAILGRLCSYAAKKSLGGYTIKIVNSEKAIITGSRKNILERYDQMVKRGGPHYGPYISKTPHMMLKRTIRGMLPYRIKKGLDALKRIKCYKGNESNLPAEQIKSTQLKILKIPRYITIGEVCRAIKK